MRVKINLKSVALYAFYTLFLLCINKAVAGVPLSLGLCFSMLICGTNLIATPVIYVLATLINPDWITLLLGLFEGAFVTAVTYIYRRAHKKIRAESAAYVCVALAPFIAFSRWSGIESLYFTDNAYIMKAVAACAVIIFTFFCFKSVYALLYRLFRCRLRADEIVCLAVTFTVFGVGLYNLCGLYATLCIFAGLIILTVRLCKSPACTVVACIAGIPLAVTTLSPDYMTALVVLSVLALLFCGAGRYAPSAVCIVAAGGYFYLIGAYSVGIGTAIVRALLLLCCLVAAVIPTEKRLKEIYNLLSVKTVLPSSSEERFKSATGERLFRLSEVFREIECAFVNLDQALDDGALRIRISEELKLKTCAECPRREKCKKTDVYVGFRRLIDSGCAKGKVSLVDLSSEITTHCAEAANVIKELNKLLAEYRKLTLEAENARSGRMLLANQAKGVSEVLKGCAAEISKTPEQAEETERAILKELSANGISCPEIRLYDGDNAELMLTVVGKANLTAAREAILRATGKSFILKDKIVYDGDKSCLVFGVPPKFDAAFGVAHAVKDGEKVSGDTHSVIKINEHSFLMVLSDGTGSGEYAKKVSSTAISLIEAFYRAEMPTKTMLETVNKLICFNRDERFTCIDVAAIDLNNLSAGFIKIGSPAGIIVRQGEIKVLESRSLPLGILDTLRPTVCEEKLKNGDIVVFMSDGITSAFSTTAELYEFLQTLKPLNPQSLAEQILNAAKERSGGVPDDMTAVCARIFKRQ